MCKYSDYLSTNSKLEVEGGISLVTGVVASAASDSAAFHRRLEGIEEGEGKAEKADRARTHRSQPFIGSNVGGKEGEIMPCLWIGHGHDDGDLEGGGIHLLLAMQSPD